MHTLSLNQPPKILKFEKKIDILKLNNILNNMYLNLGQLFVVFGLTKQ